MLSLSRVTTVTKCAARKPTGPVRRTQALKAQNITVRQIQVPAFLKSFPIIRKTLSKVGLGPKPPKVPSIEEFEKSTDCNAQDKFCSALLLQFLALMDDSNPKNPLADFLVPESEQYAWAVVGTRIPSPWDSTETLSRTLLRKLIEKNHLQAKYTYATMIVTGSMRGDTTEAIKLWEECSRAGHSWAKSNLARVLMEGRIVRQDLDRSAMLYEEAWGCAPVLSESHAHTSALNLADLYMNHLWRSKDGVKWLHTAADEAHDILAQYQLGHAYSYGKFDLPVDLVKARDYTQKAADGNLVLAQHNLGCLLYEGIRVEPALNAENDSTPATLIQGEPDYVGAAYYFSRAHLQEYYWSSLNLAGMYADGKGVPQNFVTAKLLVKEVSAFGSDAQKTAAIDVLQRIEKMEDGEKVEEPQLQMKSPPSDRNPSAPLNVGL